MSASRQCLRRRGCDERDRFDLEQLREAAETAARLRRALRETPDIGDSLRAAQVLTSAIEQAIEGFEHQWVDAPADRLQALRNLSISLENVSRQVRRDVALAIGIVLEVRGADPGSGSEPTGTLEALCREITRELERMAPGEPPEAAQGQVAGPAQRECAPGAP